MMRDLYPGLDTRRLYRCGAFNINSTNWKIITPTGNFLLKECTPDKKNTLAIQAALSEALLKRRIPSVSFLPTRTQSLVGLSEGSVFCLSHFIEGAYFSGDTTEWQNLLKQLKMFYVWSLRSRISAHAPLTRRGFFTAKETAFIHSMRNRKRIGPMSEHDTEWLRQKCQEVFQFYQSHQKRLHNGIFHIDLHPLNLIFQKKKLVLITDFDSLQRTKIEVALGFAVFKCLREVIVGQIGAHALSTVVKQKEKIVNKTFRTLSLSTLLALGQVEILKRINFILSEYVDGNKQWFFMLDTQWAALHEIDAINSIVA